MLYQNAAMYFFSLLFELLANFIIIFFIQNFLQINVTQCSDVSFKSTYFKFTHETL